MNNSQTNSEKRRKSPKHTKKIGRPKQKFWKIFWNPNQSEIKPNKWQKIQKILKKYLKFPKNSPETLKKYKIILRNHNSGRKDNKKFRLKTQESLKILKISKVLPLSYEQQQKISEKNYEYPQNTLKGFETLKKFWKTFKKSQAVWKEFRKVAKVQKKFRKIPRTLLKSWKSTKKKLEEILNSFGKTWKIRKHFIFFLSKTIKSTVQNNCHLVNKRYQANFSFLIPNIKIICMYKNIHKSALTFLKSNLLSHHNAFYWAFAARLIWIPFNERHLLDIQLHEYEHKCVCK